MASSSSEIVTLVNCFKAIAVVAGVCTAITLFYIVRKQDLGLSIYKLLINGVALAYALTAIKYYHTKHSSSNYKNDILYYFIPTFKELLKMMILTLVLYTLKRTRYNNIDVFCGIMLLILLWLSGIIFLAIEFSPSLWNKISVENASLMVIFAIRTAILIFAAFRLPCHFGEDTANSQKTSLLALNLIRLLFIFVSLMLQGPAALDRNRFTVVPGAVILIIILFLTSFKIEYPQNLQKPGIVNTTISDMV